MASGTRQLYAEWRCWNFKLRREIKAYPTHGAERWRLSPDGATVSFVVMGGKVD